MGKFDNTAIAIAGAVARDLEEETLQRRTSIAILMRRLEKAGIPDLDPEEKRELRLSIRQPPVVDPDPAGGAATPAAGGTAPARARGGPRKA